MISEEANSYKENDDHIGTDGATSSRWREGIAIVGMSARFPKSADVAEFWQNLAAGKSLLESPSDEELQAVGIDPGQVNSLHFVKSGTRLEGAETFDAPFFGITRREAEIMDPQHRVFLECAFEALEHAGIVGDGENIGVFAGSGMNTYMLQLIGNPAVMELAGGYQLMLGNDKDFLSTRVAFKLNLQGPAVAVQTACSTSLAAVHMACQSLLSGECDAALAGGVSIVFPQVAGYNYVPGMILSPDGICRPFDESARGTVPGKGAGIVVLKRESDAIADGDKIYAVIAGSAWNNDGSSKVGYTAPSVAGQVKVIQSAHAAAGVSPNRIQYVEAHGTGTELGDPIEVAALAEAFGTRSAGQHRCVLGSVKANMGHPDVAAGVAGLIKATLAVHHGVIPPTPHFEKINPAFDLENTPFRVSARAEQWPEGETEHWAGVSSFGIGGTNVHLCLRSSSAVGDRSRSTAFDKPDAEIQPPFFFPLSAKTETALNESVRRLADFIESSNSSISISDVASTLQNGRRTFVKRRAVVASDADELVRALRDGLTSPLDGDQTSRQNSPRPVAFLFPGQGQQFRAMTAELYSRDPRFREWIDRGLSLLPKTLTESILWETCFSASSESGSKESGRSSIPTNIAQPLLFLIEYALAMRWIEAGVRPHLLLGHSLGELTAAAVAGVFSFEDGIRLAAERGRLMHESVSGAMVAVSLGVDDVVRYLNSELWIAAENSPRLTVISGEEHEIDGLVHRLSLARIGAIRLATDRAFHTPHMASASTLFRDAVAAVNRFQPKMRWLSNVTGTWITTDEATTPEYWADQMTSRVRFSENAAIVAASQCFLLEVGPGDALGSLVGQQQQHHSGSGTRSGSRRGSGTLYKDRASSIGQSVRKKDDLRTFLEAAAQLWELGYDLDWHLLPGYCIRPQRIALPTYPFERQRYWIDANVDALGSRGKESFGFESALYQKRADLSSWFYVPSWQRTPTAALALGNISTVQTWIMLDDDCGLSREIARLLKASGLDVFSVPTTALSGKNPHSRKELDLFWKLRGPQNAGSMIGLINCSTLQHRPVVGQLAPHLIADSESSSNDVYESFLIVLRSAQRAKVRFAQIEVVFDELAEVDGERIEEPRRAVAEGLTRILPAEFVNVPVRIIDVGQLDVGQPDGAGQLDGPGQMDENFSREIRGVEPNNLSRLPNSARLVCSEIMAVPLVGSALFIAFRRNSRWEQTWQRMPLRKVTKSRIRTGGTYVITGGLGGVAYKLAEHLILNYQARVALIGRTVLPPRASWEEFLTDHGPSDPTSRRIGRAKSLELLGGQILLLNADVADMSEMEAAWFAIEGRFGEVNGVIHAAGLSGGSRIAAQKIESVRQTLRPKVEGSEVIVELLTRAGEVPKQLDFVVFCSSISSILPLAGASDYAAANAFQDRYAVWCRQHLGLPAISINFDAWQELGMLAETEATAESQHLKDARLRTAMNSAEAIEAFERILVCGETQVLISTVDFAHVLSIAVQMTGTVPHKDSREEPDPTQPTRNDEIGPIAQTLALPETLVLQNIWQELLGMESVSPDDNFFELGGHSLLGTMVLARIRERYGIELTIRAIFDAPTPEALGRRIHESTPTAEPVGVVGDREEFEF